MKKIIALVLALAMILMVGAVYADGDGDGESITPKNDNRVDTTFSGSADGTISIGGLDKGDVVKFYQVLEFSQDASIKVADLVANSDMSKGAGGWKFTEKFVDDLDGTDLKAILTRGITDELAGKIALSATGSAKYEKTVESGTSVIQDPADDGLYVAIITAGQAGIVYNPIFVASDYYVTGNKNVSNNWDAEIDALSYSNSAMAKKTKITVDKTAKDITRTNDDNDTETVSVGDIVEFTVKSIIPEFADNYTKAIYNVTDVLSDGLELKKDSIKVYTATIENDEYKKGSLIESGFSIPESTLDEHGYKIVFSTKYLLDLNAAQPIWIEYQATVTSAAETNVTVEDNTVTINYSNDPTDETGSGYIKDETKNYTFSIDANLLGTENENNPWKTIEVVKVGLDKNGKEILAQSITWHKGETITREIGPLAGAQFVLYDANKNEYHNEYIPEGKKIISDSTGRLTIEGKTYGIMGLDAGTYYLRETQAPDGYIKAQQDVKIEIIADIQPVTITDENGVSWSYNELKSYEIKINGDKTASYSMTNDHKAEQTSEIPGTTGYIDPDGNKIDENSIGKITNTQGVELPSTGGIGTTIFYILGGLLVIGAAVILVARRKAQD